MPMFKCPVCGHGLFRVVNVKRDAKPPYLTEFIACSSCKVMQWEESSEPRNKVDPPLLRTWGAARKGDK